MDATENAWKRGCLLAMVVVSADGELPKAQEYYARLGAPPIEDREVRWLRELCDWARWSRTLAMVETVGLVKIER